MTINCDFSFSCFPRLCAETVTLSKPVVDPILKPLLKAFEESTGWVLEAPPIQATERQSDLKIVDLSEKSPERPMMRYQADILVDAVNKIWTELSSTKKSLRALQSATTTAVELQVSGDESFLLSETLHELLGQASEVTGGRQAVLRILELERQILETACCYGSVDSDELYRPMPVSLAIVDHHVMEDGKAIQVQSDPNSDLGEPWSEGISVCLPVGSTANMIGTLWVQAGESSDFGPSDMLMLEVIAGRIAAELDKQALLVQLQAIGGDAN